MDESRDESGSRRVRVIASLRVLPALCRIIVKTTPPRNASMATIRLYTSDVWEPLLEVGDRENA
eukprot:405243-Prymnesium_polylepis.1